MAATGLAAIAAQARRAARRRGQEPSTAHLLLVMLQSADPGGAILAQLGVSESDLLSALKVVDQEPSSAVEVALERAAKVASALGADPESIHLLLAIARDPRTAAYRCLQHTGVGPKRAQEMVVRLLGASHPRASVDPHRPEHSSTPQRATDSGRSSGHRRPVPPRSGAARKARTTEAPPSRTTPLPPTAEPTAKKPDASRPSNRRVSRPSEVSSLGELDRSQFPLLSRLGRSLSSAARRGALDPVIGREREVEQALDVLGRRRGGNPLLVGPAGVGKTAIVEALAQKLARSAGPSKDINIIEVSAGALVSGTAVRGAVAERVRALKDEVSQADGQILLFIDEIHSIVSGQDGPDDIAQLLKGALARGEFRCIGATTDVEYRRSFERDSALARRFTKIDVGEPTREDAVAIVEGVVPRYAAHHGVAYEPSSLEASVDLSSRFLTEQCLPDKAISLLDVAGARVRRRGHRAVDTSAVAEVVAERIQVPIERILMTDRERLLALDALLRERIVGHEEAIDRIARRLRRTAAGFRGSGPLGSFLLLGPTGVGKTETAKAVSELLFPGAGLCRFDMSEFSEPHSVARLLGAPPGYLGHEEGGQLVEAVRRRPYQVVLLDEIDKAHLDVLLALLPLLDEGRLTDGRGRTVDFTQTIVFMTSNLGAAQSLPRSAIGFQSEGEPASSSAGPALAAARAALPPELWNRIDETLHFRALDRAEVRQIARRLLERVRKTALSQGIDLCTEDSALDLLVEQGGFDATLGARPMRRAIGTLVEAPLAELLLTGCLQAGESVRLVGSGARIELQKCRPGAFSELGEARV